MNVLITERMSFFVAVCVVLSACVTQHQPKDLNDSLPQHKPINNPELLNVTDEIDLMLTDIQKEKSYWSEGLMVGTRAKAVHSGIFFSTFDMEFLLTGGISGSNSGNYSPILTKVTPYKKKVFFEYRDITTSGAMVLKYVHRHPWNPANLFTQQNSRYFVYKVDDVLNFDETESFKKHGRHFVEKKGVTWKGWAAEGTHTGYIGHVSRWGSIDITCTIYLHEGGEKTIEVTDTGYTIGGVWTDLDIIPTPDGVSVGVARVTRKVDVPNINEFNVYSEEGCTFAENAAASVSKVLMDVSRQYLPTWHKYKTIVHEIRVIEPPK